MAYEEEEVEGHKGPIQKLKNNWRCIEIPVNQYTGVRETNKTIPYLCFKHSEDRLKDEEEKKSLLIDIKPLIGKNPLIRPHFGYEKIGIDLRQIPIEFIRQPNNDYVFLSYQY